MKLIHLPTGETYEEKIQPYKLLNKYPENYICAEIPKHWRVEGYEKSWEWMEIITDYNKTDKWEWIGYDGIKVDSYPNGHPVTRYMEIISKAEFEYHIYNPWKEGQAPKPTSLYAEQEKKKENEMNWTCSSQARWLVDPSDELLKDPTRPKIDYDKANLEYVQLLAESMGYELVRKKRDEIEWVIGDNKYTLVDGGLHVVEMGCEEGVFINHNQFITLIEKYNQFNGTPAT